MAVISYKCMNDKKYTFMVTSPDGNIEEINITSDGIYSINYIQNGKNKYITGNVKDVYISSNINSSFLTVDSSVDNSNRRERIYLMNIVCIKDITPNDAYKIAVKHGFIGSIEEWLEYLKGYSPVLGKDYWTDDDKNIIKAEVSDMITSEIDRIDKKLNGEIVEEYTRNKINSYSGKKLEGESDEEAIERILDEKQPNINDHIVLISLSEDTGEYIYTPYIYYGSWVTSIAGNNINSDNVIVNDDIVITTEDGETEVIDTKGKSIYEVMTILAKEVQPTIEEPKVIITLVNAGEKEVGSYFTPEYTAELLPGSYSYGPDTGIEALEWEITDSNGNISNSPTGSFNSFLVIDDTEYTISAKATYGDGTIPITNIKNEYPAGQIKAGYKLAVSEKVTGFRNFFYGACLEPIELDSSSIRSNLINGGRTIPDSFSINIPEGTNQVIIALFDRSIESITDTKAFGIDILSCFELVEMHIEGMSGFNSKPYKIYIYNPSVAIGKNNYIITIK